MRIIGRNDGDRDQAADMEWSTLPALPLTGRSRPSREQQLTVFGSCCGPPARQAEPGGELEVGG
jgi:hypothetical protein